MSGWLSAGATGLRDQARRDQRQLVENRRNVNETIAWSVDKDGPYQLTPIVYGEHLYTCSNDGMVSCYEATTG